MRGVNINMFYDDLNTEEQVSYLIKPILQVLQEAGGQLERSEIRDRISELDEHIAEFEQKLYTSNKTGNQYKKFDFKFNFAIKELSYLLVRRITITANKLVDEKSVKQEDEYQQLDLFTDYEAQRKKQAEEEEKLERERRMQEAMLSIKKKFGKNAVLKGMNLEEGATAKDRNEQIGGHKA